jgi:sugar fermentation stimulation protein A
LSGDRLSPPRFRGRLSEGTFLSRPNRFIVECRTGSGRVRAYLPNPGRLRELLLPGSAVTLLKAEDRGDRRTAYTAVAVRKGAHTVLLHTHHTNEAAHWLIERGRVPGLAGFRVERREVTRGHSRFDFLLRRGGERMLLEVKSCTLFGRKIAMFPDAVTARGRRHLLELAALADGEVKTGVLFLIHWPGARWFLPDYHTDPAFSRALRDVRGKVRIMPVAVKWSRELTLTGRGRSVAIPWDLLEREDRDGGSYILVLRLSRKRRIGTGALGDITYPRGFYLYVGSAKRGLAKRTERHRRIKKKLRWHIDYLRERADLHAIFPVRTSDDLECAMAARLGRMAGWRVPRFGSSDCRCPSHLFGMEGDPLADKGFIDLVSHFRIDRLQSYLDGKGKD